MKKSSQFSQHYRCWWCVFPILLILLASLACMPTTALCRPPDRTSVVETPGDPEGGERGHDGVISGGGFIESPDEVNSESDPVFIVNLNRFFIIDIYIGYKPFSFYVHVYMGGNMDNTAVGIGQW